MTQPKARRSRVRRWFENIVLLIGVIGIGLWAASILIPMVWQDWGNWTFDNELRGQTATIKGYLSDKVDQITQEVEGWLRGAPIEEPSVSHATVPRVQPPPIKPSMKENALIGRLTIPRLHLSAIVREGVGQSTLGLAVGHIPGTSLPGQNGNVAVAGHRDTLFLGLRGIKANDLIQFETLDGTYQYEVKSTEIVTPRDVDVLNASRYSELTLVTCYPFNYIGSAPDRFIVKAREVSANSSRGDLPDGAKESLGEEPGTQSSARR